MSPHPREIQELHVLVPFWGMAGGVIKILDYVAHARALGVGRIHLWAPPLPAPDSPVMTLPVVRSLLTGDSAPTLHDLDDLDLTTKERPWVLFTEPTHHHLIDRQLTEPLDHRLIHLVQGTRHANPDWAAGRNYRLLHRPMSRIFVSEQVARATEPHVNTRFPGATIIEGHDTDYFAAGAPDRDGVRSTHRVLYTTWKSDLGDRIAELASGCPELSFDAIRRECGWPELRRRYHDADMFLCTPGPEEGFYLPGLEAMAAGCAVVGALVGGNAAYMTADQNAVAVPYDDAPAHLQALLGLAHEPHRHQTLVSAGRATAESHRLQRERSDFGELLSTLIELDATHN